MKLTGKRPVGFRAPAFAFSQNTLELLQAEGFAYDASLMGGDVPYLIGNERGDLVELPSDFVLDDWMQYVCLGDFNYMLPIASPQRATEVFQAEFDAAWRHGGLWVSVWHPFVSGRLSRADAMAGLIDHMQEKGGVWFASLEEIAAHVRSVIATGAWTPRRDTLPYWPQPRPRRRPGMTAMPRRLNVSHYMPEDHGSHADFIAPWARAVEAAAAGSLTLAVHSGASPFGKLENQHAQVAAGTVDIAHSPAGLPEGRFPLTTLMNLPFMAASSSQGTQMLNALLEPHLAVEYKGLKVLALHADSGGVLHTRDAPVTRMEQIEGLRLRCPAGPMEAALRLLGAEPVPLTPSQHPRRRRGGSYRRCRDGVGRAGLYPAPTRSSAITPTPSSMSRRSISS